MMGITTRGGKKIEWQPIHQGRTGKNSSTLPGQLKRASREKTNTRLSKKTSQKVESEKKQEATFVITQRCQHHCRDCGLHEWETKNVTFRDFGPDRESQCPGCFFCHNCKMADEALVCSRKSTPEDTISMKKHQCLANHTSIFNPKEKSWVPSAVIKKWFVAPSKNVHFLKSRESRKMSRSHNWENLEKCAGPAMAKI